MLSPAKLQLQKPLDLPTEEAGRTLSKFAPHASSVWLGVEEQRAWGWAGRARKLGHWATFVWEEEASCLWYPGSEPAVESHLI